MLGHLDNPTYKASVARMPASMIGLVAGVVAVVRREHAAGAGGHCEGDVENGAVVHIAGRVHNGRPQHRHVVPIKQKTLAGTCGGTRSNSPTALRFVSWFVISYGAG